MYNATIVRLGTPRPHSNADNLHIFDVLGYQVIINKTHQEGELGIFFPADGQVSEEYAKANDLVGYKDEEGNRKGGFMDDKRRVKAINLRGEKSYGLWMPISSLSFLGTDYPPEGTDLNTFHDHEFCTKYITERTRRAGLNNQKRARKKNPMFLEHVDTKQLRHKLEDIPKDCNIYITEKVHGTSGRFGYVVEEVSYPWYHPLSWFGVKKREWVHLNGSRRVVLKDRTEGNSFYGTDAFRFEATERLIGKLRKGETLYFELVGWVDADTPIMPPVNTKILKDKSYVEEYGETMYYKYGTLPGECRLIVYRITMTNEDGESLDLSWPQVQERCRQLGVESVIQLGEWKIRETGLFGIDATTLKQYAENLSVGPSEYDHTHMREGVVLRIEYGEPNPMILKEKSHEFLVLEGHTKDREDYVDMEEMS